MCAIPLNLEVIHPGLVPCSHLRRHLAFCVCALVLAAMDVTQKHLSCMQCSLGRCCPAFGLSFVCFVQACACRVGVTSECSCCAGVWNGMA